MKYERVRQQFLDELQRVPVVQIACERCGISRQTAYRWRNEDVWFKRDWDIALEEGEAFINDMAESQLLQLVKDKQFGAIRYWLSCRHPKFKKEKVEVVKYPPTKTGINPGFYQEWIATLSDEEIVRLLRDKHQEDEE